jgi:tetratricopeptide (TPR) repeat protein
MERLPGNPSIMDTMGWIYYKLRAYDSAVDLLKQCVDKDPKNSTYQYHLGMSYYQLNKKDQARSHLDNALRLSASFAGADEAKRTLATLRP